MGLESDIEKKVKGIISKIKLLRNKKEYSQEYVGDRLGIGQVAYHKLENGKTSLKIDVLLKLAVILEVETSFILK
ncbi:helix-turn-helix transcriptional regulator [uncultured Polaribacter sp.]|uniref:helix-turn-helix domain-containing protein n=1 Tax=uncultured Polaribacter sp. TaxID=174711 RepID=UPI002618ADCE|nr:helix-turn-helix transcriptional regulator [uncultured Polaribacter sp.]